MVRCPNAGFTNADSLQLVFLLKKKSVLLLIELQHVGSIEYFAQMLHHGQVLIEQHEHFERSTLRNRHYIATSNNIIHLSVPLQHGRQQRRKMLDVRLSYSYAWQRQQWHSLEAAYRSSPFFEYFEDALRPFYEKNYLFLWDYNTQLLHTMLQLLRLNCTIGYTTEYQKHYPAETCIVDYRSRCCAKQTYQPTTAVAAGYTPPTYRQVFAETYPFVPNLSIIDLLCNTGMQAVALLQASVVATSNHNSTS